MDNKLLFVLFLTFLINLIGTIAYCTRIAGIRTGKIAICFSIFNIFSLVSRTANSLQSPFLAKAVEIGIKTGNSLSLVFQFRYILLSSTLGCVFGAVIIPTFQRVFCKAVDSFNIHRSIPRLLIHGFSKAGILQFKSCVKKPSRRNIKELNNFKGMPKKIIVFNVAATALSTTAVLSSMYAGALNPQYRSTCSSLTSVINGLATLLLFIFIDPCLSIMTDDVINGKCSEGDFRRCISFMVSSRIVGTILAQFFFIPSAIIISKIAVVI